jgi:4-carboxymuconolactone decarboxylase
MMGIKNTFTLTLSVLLLAVSMTMSAQESLPPDVRTDTLSRLTPAKRDDLDDYGKAVWDRVLGRDNTGPFYGPTGFYFHMPRVADGMDLINNYLRYESIIGRGLIEVAICVLAREFDSQYEWASHAPIALSEGVPQEVIDVIAWKRPVDGLAPEYSLVIRYGREIFNDHKLSSETWAEAVSLFGQQGALEIGAIMADYAMAAVILHAVDQQIPPERTARMPVLE